MTATPLSNFIPVPDPETLHVSYQACSRPELHLCCANGEPASRDNADHVQTVLTALDDAVAPLSLHTLSAKLEPGTSAPPSAPTTHTLNAQITRMLGPLRPGAHASPLLVVATITREKSGRWRPSFELSSAGPPPVEMPAVRTQTDAVWAWDELAQTRLQPWADGNGVTELSLRAYLTPRPST